MNVTVELKSIRPAVTAAKKLTGRAYIAAMNGIRLTAHGETLHVESTDLDLSVSVRVPATVRESGTVLVDAKSLAVLVKGKGSVILSTTATGLRVENGIASDLPALDLSEYPAPAATWAETAHRVELSTVAEVAAAASGDQARPILTGILFDGASIVATDSYRLHLADDTGTDVPAVLVPSRAFGFLPKSGRAYLTTGTETRPGTPYATYSTVDGEKVRTVHETTTTTDVVRVESESVTVVARVIDGAFPNYRQLIPSDQPHAVTFEREAFLKVVAAVGATLAKSVRPVRLKVDGSELVVFATGDDGEVSSSGRVPCKGDDLGMFPAIAFNPAFLSDAVSTLRGDFATLHVTDSLKPASLSERQEGGANAIRLLMPVRT